VRHRDFVQLLGGAAVASRSFSAGASAKTAGLLVLPQSLIGGYAVQ
jgi:hypothetical protein